MKGPGFWRASGLIAAKDIRLEVQTWETLTSSVIFSLIVLVIFNFAFGLSAMREIGVERLVPGVLWLVLAFAAVVGMARSMQMERQRDTLAALFMTPIDRGALFMGKLLANLAKLASLQAVVVPLSAIFFDYNPVPIALPLATVLLLHGLGLTVLGTLFAGITARVGRGEALLATLLFPGASPILISAVKCTEPLIGGRGLGSVTHWLWITLGFDVLYIFVALLTFEFIMEE